MKTVLAGLLFVLCVWACNGSCPSLCTCKNNKAGDGTSVGEVGPGELLKIKCGGSGNQITEMKEIDFNEVLVTVLSLNLSGNSISTLSRDLHLPYLQKLDLSRNQITLIESDAFYNLTNLLRLDLSNNFISNVYKEMFKSLVNLERLILAHNNITTLADGTFDYLVGLKQLDITENQLYCDCNLLWIVDWSRKYGVKLVGNLKCDAPKNMVDKTIRKLKIFLDLSACSSVIQLNSLLVKPANDQVVFEGDSLTLSCNAPFASVKAKYELKWIHPMLEVCVVNITNTVMQEDGTAETNIHFPNITSHHMGSWICIYSDQDGLKHNYTVEVVVLSNVTQYCMTDQNIDNKGLYAWPQLLVNHTASVPCRSGEGFAYRYCHSNGTWGVANTSDCSYISNITKLLQQFSLLNVSLVPYSAYNATERLAMLIQEKTYPLAEISDPDDVKFVSEAIKNYMQYVEEERDLGSSLLDIISVAMNITPSVMAKAETQYGACTNIVQAAERLSLYTNNVQGHKSNMALERFPVRDGFSGVTCMWHAVAAGDRRLLHCTTTNRTVAPLLSVSHAQVHASIQIPQSLFYSTTEKGVLLAQNKVHNLIVSIYDQASLFPLFLDMDNEDELRGHRQKDYYGRSTKREDVNMEIMSPVVGFKLLDVEVRGELLEPVITMVRARGTEGRVAVWDPHTRRWKDNATECKISHTVGEMVVISCNKPAYVGLLRSVETGIYGARTDGARFKVSHPAVYVGSLVLLGCLAAASFTYVTRFVTVSVPRRAKHAAVNTWAAQAALCLVYTLGIYQTEDARLCRVVGLLVHYLSLCCPLWMLVSAAVMYGRVTRGQAESRTPLLGAYLTGWGLAFVVCGISAAVDLKQYAARDRCSPSTPPALAALLVPGGLLLLLLAGLFAATKLALNRTPNPARTAAATQLRAQSTVAAVYIAVWSCGAVVVYRPLPAYLPYQEDICSIIYAICATVLGTFVLFFYGIAKGEVRAQWAAIDCYHAGKQCCRSRSVFDAATTDNRSRSGSRSSNRTNSKTNNSVAYKAAAELNGLTLKKDTKNAKNNINLVTLHRRQYRSNNSMMTYPESGGAGPGTFYNANQMSVAKKFFKKQRQHSRRNFLELPARRDCDSDSHFSLPLPAREAYGVASMLNSGSKINNTNIHIAKFDTGIKENRNVLNPNILEEECKDNIPYKTYCSDKKPLNIDDPKSRQKAVMNIYTNVPETQVPQHQIIASNPNNENGKIFPQRSSVSEECLQSHTEPEMRTISQQCSLEYSSASEIAMPHTCSDQTLNTHSELTSLQETHSALCSTNEITDTESFGQYIDYLHKDKELVDKSLQDISEECTMNSDDIKVDDTKDEADDDKDAYFETCSTNPSEQGFENESDIYCPNYQVSEVSIRSHGLYAPSPPRPNEMSFSTEDVSESRYVNYDPGWRSTVRREPKPRSCPDVNREDSPVSFASDLDDLYTRIATNGIVQPALDGTLSSDVTLRAADSDVSEAVSDIQISAETTV